MTSRGIASVLGVAVLGTLAWGQTPSAPATGGVKNKLTMEVVDRQVMVFAPSDGKSPLVSGGVVQAKKFVTFMAKDAEKPLTLGPATVTLTRPGGREGFTVKAGGVTSTHKYVNGGFAPATLDIEKGRSYVLAFPQVFPGTQVARVSYRAGAVQKGTVAGTPIAFFDDNTDGVYSAEDGVRFGNGASAVAVFAPIRKYAASKSAIVELGGLSEAGTEVTATKYAGATGKLSVSGNIDAEVQLVLESSDADLSLVVTPQTEMAVVPGEYKLAYGVVYSPKLKKLVATVSEGTLPSVTVKQGQKGQVTIGGPLSLAFKPVVSDRKVTVDSASFVVSGKNGERYANFTYTAGKAPEVAWVIDGRSMPAGKMAFG